MNIKPLHFKLATAGVLVIAILIVLLFVKPTVTLPIKIATTFPQNIVINAQTSRDLLKALELHLYVLPNGKKIFSTTLTYTNSDFSEGESTISIQKAIDLKLAMIVSKETFTVNVLTDRVAPELTINDYPKQLVLQDLTISGKTDSTNSLLVNDIKQNEIKNDSFSLKLPIKTGVNDFEIKAVDTAGNYSPVIKVSTQGFNEVGYIRQDCKTFVFPIRKGRFMNSCTLKDNSHLYMKSSADFWKYGSVLSVGASGFLNEAQLKTYILDSGDPGFGYFKKLAEDTYTSPFGVTFKHYSVIKDTIDFGRQREEHYIIVKNKQLYDFSSSANALTMKQAEQDIWAKDIKTAVDYLIFK